MNAESVLDINREASAKVPRLGWLMLVMIVLGAIGFTLAASEGIRAWQAYWINFLFWTGLAQAGVVLAAIVHMARGRWGGALIRIGLLQAAFLPVSLVLYLGIVIGSTEVIPWVADSSIADSIGQKSWWLDHSFLLIRDFVGLLILTIASLAFAYFVLRPDVALLAEQDEKLFPGWLTGGRRNLEAEKERSRKILTWLTPLLLIIYCLVYSLIGFDMVMSLDPHWYSNLFGGYYFITTLYIGIAALIVISALLRRPLGLEDELNPKRFHDIGKMLFAFCLLAGDFFWSQFLVIWYGDLPEEIHFVIQRIDYQPWSSLAYAVLFGGFVIPFIILINRKVKQIPFTAAIVGLIVLAGGFAERLLMVLPSLHPEEGASFPIGIPELLISIGFLGLYGTSLLWALRRAPLVPAAEQHEDH